MTALKRPFFKYPGSKWQAVKHHEPPRFDRVREPFAGSACYSTRYHEREVILHETDPEIVALWRYLIRGNSSEIGSLPFDMEPGDDIRSLNVSDGAKLLIRQWQRVGRNDCWTVSKWNGANTGFWCESTRDQIARQVNEIRHWRISDAPAVPFAFDLTFPFGIGGGDGQRSTWYIDAPYVSRAAFYRQRFNDHALLGDVARLLNNAGHQVMVCECEGATWLPFRLFRKQVTGRRGKKSGSKEYSREVVWP